MSYENAGGYKIRDQYATHFLTFTIMGWIDVFSRKQIRDIIIDSFLFCRQRKALQIGAYVIMTNHIHTFWTAPNGNLSDIVRDFKTHTSKTITESLKQSFESRREWLDYMFKYFANGTNRNDVYKVWTSHNHPEVVYSSDFMHVKLNYLHQNPVKAGIVARPEHYLYSSASNYLLGTGLMDIDYLY